MLFTHLKEVIIYNIHAVTEQMKKVAFITPEHLWESSGFWAIIKHIDFYIYQTNLVIFVCTINDHHKLIWHMLPVSQNVSL